MPQDLQSIADPQLIVLGWAAGLALVAGTISRAQIVGRGFIWLTAGVAAVLSIPGALVEGGWWARAGLVSIVVGIFQAGRPRLAGPVLVGGAIALVAQGTILSGWLPTVTATVALGGVTGEMLLGHWYLIDPRLPRLALRMLAVTGIVGLVGDGSILASGLPAGGATVAFWVLLATSVVLMVGVIGALRYPAYSGVMAATGLSYLAVLTTLGVVFLGRALVAGVGPFSS